MRRNSRLSFLWSQNLTQLFSDVPIGHFVNAEFDRTLVTLTSSKVVVASSPADEVAFLAVANTSNLSDTLRRAVVSASHSMDSWSQLSPSVRFGVMSRFADTLAAARSDVLRCHSICTGQPISIAHMNAQFDLPDKDDAAKPGSVTLVRTDASASLSRLWTVIARLLMQGSTIVWNPSPESPLVPQVIAELSLSCSLPRGVLNIVHGNLDDISLPPNVSVVTTFTRENPLQTIGVIQHEVSDAVLDAVDRSLSLSCGQHPSFIREILVPTRNRIAFIRAICQRLTRIKIGHPLDPTTNLGPLKSGLLLEESLTSIAEMRRNGAQLVMGGYRATMPHGYFVAPTVLLVRHLEGIGTFHLSGPAIVIRMFDDRNALDHALTPLTPECVSLVSDDSLSSFNGPVIPW